MTNEEWQQKREEFEKLLAEATPEEREKGEKLLAEHKGLLAEEKRLEAKIEELKRNRPELGEERAEEPREIRLGDGIARKIRFTNGSLKRLMKRFGVKTAPELFAFASSDFTVSIAAFLHEGLIDKDGLTEEDIDELIPMRRMKSIYATVIGAMTDESGEDEKNGVGRAANAAQETPVTTISTGYVNGVSADTLELAPLNSGNSPEPKPEPS